MPTHPKFLYLGRVHESCYHPGFSSRHLYQCNNNEDPVSGTAVVTPTRSKGPSRNTGSPSTQTPAPTHPSRRLTFPSWTGGRELWVGEATSAPTHTLPVRVDGRPEEHGLVVPEEDDGPVRRDVPTEGRPRTSVDTPTRPRRPDP